MEIPADMFYFFLLRRHTEFGLKIFEIDFVIEFNDINDIWPFGPSPGPQGRG